MTRLLLALGFSGLATAALAQGRPSTETMTCNQTQALIAARGSVVLGTGPFTYDRYVRDQGFCALGEASAAAWERTVDAAQCPVGYRCKPFGETQDRDSR